jgi:hypothetical protein
MRYKTGGNHRAHSSSRFACSRTRAVLVVGGCVLVYLLFSLISLSASTGKQKEQKGRLEKQRAGMDVFILAGQSNMAGRGAVEELDRYSVGGRMKEKAYPVSSGRRMHLLIRTHCAKCIAVHVYCV